MVLEAIFGPLLTLPDALAVLIYGIIVLILINIGYKFLMDQNKVQAIKKEMKELNVRMKDARKDNDMEKTKELMSESMKLSSQQMHMTMKPMLVSMVVVVLLLPFLHAHYSDVIISQDSNNVTLDSVLYDVSRSDSIISLDNGEITKTCELPCKLSIAKRNWDVFEENDNIKFQHIVAALPVSLPFFGDDFGWLIWYFIVSIPIMIILRKLMGIKI